MKLHIPSKCRRK